MKHSNARYGGRRPHKGSLRSVFGVPLAIAAVGSVGLVSALTGDGWRDLVSWIGLAVPVAVTGWAMIARRS